MSAVTYNPLCPVFVSGPGLALDIDFCTAFIHSITLLQIVTDPAAAVQ